jgi:hypothetical protein
MSEKALIDDLPGDASRPTRNGPTQIGTIAMFQPERARELILSAAAKAKGNVREMARIFDVTEVTMHRQINKLELRADVRKIRSDAIGVPEFEGLAPAPGEPDADPDDDMPPLPPLGVKPPSTTRPPSVHRKAGRNKKPAAK